MAPAAAAPIVALGEDLLREVFIHLPASTDLVRAAAACKPFLRAARSAPFLRRFRRRHPSSCSRLLGCLLLFPNRRGAKSHFVPISASCCPSCSSSSSSAAGGCYGDFALSFLPGGGWLGQGAAATWKHLDCRNGRLLLESLGSHELAVADPISRRYVSVPAPPAGRRAVGYGLFFDYGVASEFRVVCVSRDAASPEFRALVLTSGELSWADVAGIACQPNLAAGSRAMQVQSLYWRLDGGERMVAFSTASMELSVLDLPPALRDLRFDAIDKGEEEDNVLHLLTMTGYRIEVWAGTKDGEGGMTWRQVEKSFRFHKALTEIMDPSLESYERINPSVQSVRDDIIVIGVAAGLVLFRKWTHIFSIDIKTMKLKRLPKADCLGALIYPYTIAWPPSLLNPTGQGFRCSGDQVSGLFLEDDKEKLEKGLNAVLELAQKLVTKEKHAHPSPHDAPGGDQAGRAVDACEKKPRLLLSLVAYCYDEVLLTLM